MTGVGGALILQNAVSNKYNRVINREGLNSLQALMRRPSNGTPVAITKTTTMKTILGWVQSGVCSPREALGESGLEAVGACAATAGRASDNIWVDIANNPYVGC